MADRVAPLRPGGAATAPPSGGWTGSADRAAAHLRALCVDIPERCVGTEGNRRATAYFEAVLERHGWATGGQSFEAMDWDDGGATLRAGDLDFAVSPSPYSSGFSGRAPLAAASTAAELEAGGFEGTILLLHGEVAREPLMPKGFVFWNPESHRRIVAALEASGAVALVCATGRNPSLAGGVYPFPLIEDGDFDVPSVYTTEEEGRRLLAAVGSDAVLESRARRIPAAGRNVAGRVGPADGERVVVTAHIDAKKGTPGALDNATGVTVLLLLAERLADYAGGRGVELVAFNGEDYWSVPGQMAWIAANEGRFDDVLLNVNIDGVGYREGPSAVSFYGLPDGIERVAAEVVARHPGVVEGPQWPQGDHSIFTQQGRPAVAVTSEWLIEHMEEQDITHTPKDDLAVVDPARLPEVAAALDALVRAL